MLHKTVGDEDNKFQLEWAYVVTSLWCEEAVEDPHRCGQYCFQKISCPPEPSRWDSEILHINENEIWTQSAA